jgi:hypothetical protein
MRGGLAVTLDEEATGACVSSVTGLHLTLPDIQTV